jgi:DNA-binding transcriptional ArsR family regulator
MDDTFVIDKPEQLKALADPLRQRLLNAFCCNPATTKQVARQLGEKPTRLYHHVDLMEKAGLIRLVETRQNRGTIEKYYQAAAHSFVVDHQMLRATAAEGDGQAEAQSMAVNLLEAALAEARVRFNADVTQSESGLPTMVLAEARYRFTKSQAKAFIDKMCEWLNECEGCEENQEGETYLLSAVLFPIKD